MARMNVVFEDALLEEMRDLVPSRQRSGFIEEAVRARLERGAVQQIPRERGASRPPFRLHRVLRIDTTWRRGSESSESRSPWSCEDRAFP